MTTLRCACRSCGSDRLAPVLSLGNTPLANSLLKANDITQPESTYPLDLCVCSECTLVQITENIPPEKLFREYLYFSSFSDTMLQHAQALAERLASQYALGRQSLAAEIASNDGYLLQYYHRLGIPVLGIEPALNIARVAEEKGIRTLHEFFGRDMARQLAAASERADVLHANNVLAHVPDLNGFVEGIALFLKEEGIFVGETPYVRDMVEHSEFDTIYHEHLCYFSLTALDQLFRRHGLLIFDVEHLPIHGGSLRIYARRCLSAQERSESVGQMLQEEMQWGVRDLSVYGEFRARVESLRREIIQELRKLKAQGKTIAAYGASAKGSTLLNYLGVGRETLDFVVDRSTYKQDLYTPGMHLPIYAPERLLERQPDYVLLLTWNFADEILAQQAEYRAHGGKFIIPIPETRIV